MLLFNEVLETARGLATRYKARHKLIDALAAKEIYFRIGERYIYISKGFLKMEIYNFHDPMSTLPEILKVLEDRRSQYQFTESNEPYETSLYNARKDIENVLSGEMTAKDFMRKKKGLALALRELAKEVEQLKAERAES
jgi:hypothetical protein